MDEHDGSPGRGGRRRAATPKRTVVRVIVASLLGLGLVTGVGIVVAYERFNGNLTHVDVSDQLGDDRPDQAIEGDLNVLVMGDDTREGSNGIDSESGGGSDTTILFHLSADRKFAYGISIPRDTAVMRPECYEEDETPIAASDGYVKWNDAFLVGGPACTIRQVEQLTGVFVDKYVVVDFNGFKGMVDALDGVEVCIPEDIVDTEHGITLKAGTREIFGDEALSYVRVRNVGDGTDLQRIKRQQTFISSMISEAVGAEMLARPDQLLRFLNAATKSLTTDFDNVAQLAKLGQSFNGIGLDNIAFVTTPWTYDTDKVSGGVEWLPEVEDLWQLVIDDQPLTEEFLDDGISAATNPDGTTSESADPSGGATGSSDGASDGATGGDGAGLDEEGRADASLC
ncbi:LCP family protein [Nocardioides caeni]|uniref:LCP family protein n=1 Tax=Nocardioides caeni TaxID=574700 RepID=UPI0031EF9CB9